VASSEISQRHAAKEMTTGSIQYAFFLLIGRENPSANTPCDSQKTATVVSQIKAPTFYVHHIIIASQTVNSLNPSTSPSLAFVAAAHTGANLLTSS